MASEVENAGSKIIRIFLTGPESTGKTDLTKHLAAKFNVDFIEEYAREYVENLNRPYEYADVINIAMKQVRQLQDYSKKNRMLLFVDTYLIITKIWFVEVYGKYPDWIDSEIKKTGSDLYLLCKPDIPWIQDNVRENGGEMREILFNEYETELKNANLNYCIVKGKGDVRYENAERAVKEFLKERL